jgi:hypothetical protein
MRATHDFVSTDSAIERLAVSKLQSITGRVWAGDQGQFKNSPSAITHLGIWGENGFVCVLCAVCLFVSLHVSVMVN